MAPINAVRLVHQQRRLFQLIRIRNGPRLVPVQDCEPKNSVFVVLILIIYKFVRVDQRVT